MLQRFVTITAAGLLLAACAHDGIQGSPSAEPSAATASTSATTPTAASTTTPTSSDPVKGTTFDGCLAATDTELTSWGVDPATKENLKNVPFGQHGRGCRWMGAQWGLKIYAIDVSRSKLEKPDDEFDRQERVQIGPRLGWLLHSADFISCSVAIPSGESVATVQVDLKTDLTDQHYDQCPLAVKIITQLEPRIP